MIPVDPQLPFQRLVATLMVRKNREIDVSKVFEYELSTLPASLFGENGLMNIADKPAVATAIWSHADETDSVLPTNVSYVLDGGSILQKIQKWPKGSTLKVIFDLYKKYILKHYGNGTMVVFDGGYDKPSTKDSAHLNRTKFKKGVKVKFHKNITINMKKDAFLLNRNNNVS